MVVFRPNDVRFEDTRRGFQRIDGGIDTLFRDLAAQNGGRVEVGEGGRRRGIGEVVRGHVHRLHAGDGSVARGSDALLQRPHLLRERGLIADRRRHAPEQRGNLAARLHETENIVDEQQHVLVLAVAEVFCHRQPRERDAHSDAGRFVHLSEDERRLFVHAALAHLRPQIVPLAAALAHARKDGISPVLGGDIVDEFLNEHRLADARAAEQTDLAALGIGFQKIDHFDPRLQDLHGGRLIDEIGRLSVDLPPLLRFDGSAAVNGLAQYVEHASERAGADGHADPAAVRSHLHAAGKPLAACKHDAAHRVALDVARDLHDARFAVHFDAQRLAQSGKLSLFKCDVHDRTRNAHDGSRTHFVSSLPFCACAPAETSVISCVIAPCRT